MKTLNLSTGTFDQINTFTFKKFKFNNACSLKKDYAKEGDGVYWALQHATCIKSSYTEQDKAEQARLSSGEFTLEHGEIVLIEGKQYKVRFLGDYSDCAIFDPVNS